jgi:hypothetical protein
MKILLTLTVLFALHGKVSAQLNKQETLDYILKVYQDAYWRPMPEGPQSIQLHYQTLIIKFYNQTLTSSLKDSLSCFEMTNILTKQPYWNIGTRSVNTLGGIRTEDDCKRLYRAVLHLQALVREDKANKDPFD